MAGEHRMQMPAAAHDSGEQGKQGAKPEKMLNGFVRFVALIERSGNALGTLAFTWATVVLLGGYPTVLRPNDDFWFATAIVFLEGARMFSRNNRLDYQLFFNTRGAFRPLGWNGLTLVGFYTSVLLYIISYFSIGGIGVPMLMVALVAVSRFLFPGLIRLLTSNLQCRHTVSVWSSLFPFVFWGLSVFKNGLIISNMVKLVFLLLFAVLLLLAISTLKFPCITKLVGSAQGSKQIFWHRVSLNLCMLATLVMFVFMFKYPVDRLFLVIFEVSVVVILSLGNLQIPAAIARVVLAIKRLRPHYYYSDDEKIKDSKLGDTDNLVPSLDIFYGMVLGQGILYGLACMLELSSFVPRRSLVRRVGFKGLWGLESVNMYYAYALDKCMEKDVLAPKKISLVRFAVDSLKSESAKMQFHGIRILHSLLQIEPTRMDILLELDASTKTMATIIRMLDWTRAEDPTIRLFAAKVFCEISKSFRLVTVPGTVQLISTLLDADSKLGTESMLFDTEDEDEGKEAGRASHDRQDSVHDTDDNNRGEQGQESVHHDNNLLATQARSNHQAGTSGLMSCVLRCWKRIIGFWSIPQEEPLTDKDILPTLGMSILCSLAYNDQDNCMVISRTVDLIPKIIWFTSYRNAMQNSNEVQKEILMGSSLKLLQRLSNTSGEIGIALRQTIAEHPVLLSNLTDILDGSSHELKRFAVGILRNLAIDGNMSQEIGLMQMIVKRLIDAFLSRAVPSSTNWDAYMQKVAGQALAMLTMESADNCAAMLMERGNLIGELASMICESNHKYVAAKLLQNLLLHMQPDQLLSNSDLRNLREALPKVLQTCTDAKTEGAKLEVLVGLSSQICKVIPADFARELEKGQRNETFVRWLVTTLKENMNPPVHCPGIRRALMEQAVYLMKYNFQFAKLFNQCGMKEVLLTVKKTPSRVERYKIFMGNVGLMEQKEPLTNLVATADELICRQWLQTISNVR